MANRQALRELHERLAERLKTARERGVAQSWLAVEAANVKYLIALSHAGEIFPYSAPQAVPYTKTWFLGVANLRGGLFGVVDLASFMGGAAPAQRSDNYKSESRFVALNAALGVNSALLIDRLAGLRNADAFVEVHAPISGGAGYTGRRLVDKSGDTWTELDLIQLSRDNLFLSVSV